MSFGDFEAQDLSSFLLSHSDPEALWIFLHVPKTAGSSFGTELSLSVAPYRNIHVDYEDRSAPHHEQLRLVVGRFLAEAGQARYRSASGHLPFGLVQRIVQAVPNTKVVTILRDPVQRVISDYRYSRTPKHPPYKEFIQQFPTIEDYIETPDAQNKMFRFLAPTGEQTDFASAYRQIQQNMAFIGLLEMYAMSFNILFRLFGRGDKLPVEHQRKTEPTQDNQVDVSPDLINKIRGLNELDVQLFDAVRSSLLARREDWVALREAELREASRS